MKKTKSNHYRRKDKNKDPEMNVFNEMIDNQNQLKPLTSQPRPSNLRTSPRSTHQA